MLRDLIEGLYTYWRQFERFIVWDSTGDRLDRRPYRTFNSTIETLTHLVRQTYRDVEENITGQDVTEEYVDIYGVPFSLIPFKGRESKKAEPIDRPKNHVRALPERAAQRAIDSIGED